MTSARLPFASSLDLFGPALAVSSRNFRAVGNIPFSVPFDNRDELVVHGTNLLFSLVDPPTPPTSHQAADGNIVT